MVKYNIPPNNDVLYLDLDTARTVMTEKRVQLIRKIAEQGDDITSLRSLSEHVDRLAPAVYQDIKILEKHDVLELKSRNERDKIPVLKHDYIAIKPLNLNQLKKAEE